MLHVQGRIYYLSVPGRSLPGLGIILDSPTGKVFQVGYTQLSTDTGGLETIITDSPRTSGPPLNAPIRIEEIDIELSAAFIKNPAACNLATTRFLVTSYQDPGTTSRAEASFTPTGCPPPPPPLCNNRRATKVGTGGRDVIRGTGRRDVIAALGGNDVIRGLGGNDLLCGGKGNDLLIGGAGKDDLFGAAGKDTLRGGRGVDSLHGGRGADNEPQ